MYIYIYICIYIDIYIYMHIHMRVGALADWRSASSVWSPTLPTPKWPMQPRENIPSHPPPSEQAVPWPLQDIVLLRGSCARINPLWLPPSTIRLHDYWTMYDSPSELSFLCHTPYNIGDGNIAYGLNHHPSNLRRGVHRFFSMVISARGYRAIWAKIQFYWRLRRLPGVNPKSRLGPYLDSTDRPGVPGAALLLAPPEAFRVGLWLHDYCAIYAPPPLDPPL